MQGELPVRFEIVAVGTIASMFELLAPIALDRARVSASTDSAPAPPEGSRRPAVLEVGVS